MTQLLDKASDDETDNIGTVENEVEHSSITEIQKGEKMYERPNPAVECEANQTFKNHQDWGMFEKSKKDDDNMIDFKNASCNGKGTFWWNASSMSETAYQGTTACENGKDKCNFIYMTSSLGQESCGLDNLLEMFAAGRDRAMVVPQPATAGSSARAATVSFLGCRVELH